MKITIADIFASQPVMSDAEHYAAHFARKAANGPRLIPLGRACHDCAVVCGFYSHLTDQLAEQPEPVRTEATLRWFCHNHPHRACRGNIDRLALLTEAKNASRGGGA